MAYQALYRKYRPTNFNEVVGQQSIIQTLKNAKDKDRIAHAYLFCGPRGTGKTSIAKIFARMLNCTSEEENQPCGHCENCQMALNGSHPDIIEIDAASNNGVEEVRNLIDRVKYAPMQGKYKVYIIDEVHMMTKGAFNALLKTIEEPPKHIVFIFATTEPNKVLSTIISRCQRFDFSKVSTKDIIRRLHTVCESEQIKIDEQSIELIAQLSDGGMRDALSILDQCVAYCSSEIHIDDVRNIYGVITTEDIGHLFQYLYHRDVETLMTSLQEVSDHGMDLTKFTSDFISLLKDSIILDYSANTTLIDDHMKELIQKYFMEAPLSFRMNVLENLMDIFNKFRYASNILDYLETGLLKTFSNSHEQVESKDSVNYEMKKTENHINTSDLSSDYSDIPTVKKEETPKTKEIEVSEKENVSRETLKQSEIKNSKITFENEFILQLLVSANKNIRTEDSKKCENIKQFISDLKYMRPANLLNHMHILASGENYMLIHVESEMESNEINEYQNEIGFEDFLKQVLGVRKKIFSIDQRQAKQVIQLFKVRMKEGTLPDKIQIECQDEKSEEKSKDSESPIQQVFKNIEIRED